MNYRNIYSNIVERAKKETEYGKRSLGYFEKHHILPKSLGGSNDEENLVKLTAREHFICHWLLVKMYNKGSQERKKMLYALWRMKNGSLYHKEHYINSRAYETLRIEFANAVKQMNSILQTGKNNSQYGKCWYTNRNTGESKSFKVQPVEEYWVKGRNLFAGQTASLNRKDTQYRIQKARQLWDEYHSGNFSSIRDFVRAKHYTNKSTQTLLSLIPLYKIVFKPHRWNNSSNPIYIGRYEDDGVIG